MYRRIVPLEERFPIRERERIPARRGLAGRDEGKVSGRSGASRLPPVLGVRSYGDNRDVALPKQLFRAILERIRRLRLPEMVPG